MQRPVKRIVLEGTAAPAESRAVPPGTISPEPPERLAARVGWLLPPTMIAAVAAALLLVTRGPDFLFGGALAVLFGLGFLWVLVSVLFPGRADRRCSACGAPSLQRLDRDATSGVRCSACGFQDEHASAWLLAEEEGPLERTVLRERALRRSRRAASPPDAFPPERVPRRSS